MEHFIVNHFGSERRARKIDDDEFIVWIDGEARCVQAEDLVVVREVKLPEFAAVDHGMLFRGIIRYFLGASRVMLREDREAELEHAAGKPWKFIGEAWLAGEIG